MDTENPPPKRTRKTLSPQEAAARAGLEDLQLIGVEELAERLMRSPKTIRVDVSRRPTALPPRFSVPGCRKLAWRVVDVLAWMDRMSQEQHQRRVIEEQMATAKEERRRRMATNRRRTPRSALPRSPG